MSYQTLYDRLLAYCGSDAYPFHMPGHKRRLGRMSDPYAIDITEIDRFDNLHHPEGVLREAQARAAALYGARSAFYLVNGSTAGILAAIGAALAAGKESAGEEPVILFARNAHKAAYHALYLNRARPVWLCPEAYDGDGLLSGRISPRQVESALEENPRARAVFTTSPTYDGVVSDIEAIAALAHAHGAVLVVDQAHGAHFGLHPALPKSAAAQGADLVITSLHKTLPSLTQTGLLLAGSERISPALLQRFLAIYQSSSPSYVLMSSMDLCVEMMAREGEALFADVLREVTALRERAKRLRRIRLLPTDDPTRLLISGSPELSGRRICAILREQFGIEAEMDLPGYVLCLVGAGDDAAGFARLGSALEQIDRMGAAHGDESEAKELQAQIVGAFARPLKAALPLHEAWDAPAKQVALSACEGMISGDFAYLYPPGMPLLIPGERITGETASLLIRAREAGFSLSGMEDLGARTIRVLT